jgi:sulfatase maturation enzyme AslB (radical SAM superfamily)
MDQKNPNFCALPFIALEKRHNRYRPCCQFKNDDWPIVDDIDEYWQSQELKNLQQNFLLGIKDKRCNFCWAQEDLGTTSLRQAINISRVKSVDTKNVQIKQIKLITGKTCNLSCMMCFSTVSSSYQQLWKNDPVWIMPGSKSADLEYEFDVDSYVRKNAGQLEYIEALGGEPLFSKNFLSLVEYLNDTGQSSHITLFIITNGTILTPNMIELFGKFKKTIFTVSVDGIGLVNDYQRWPSDWKTIDNNIKTINGLFDISILPTVTALNINRLHEVYDYCDQNHITINNFNVVSNWPELLPINLPEKLKEKVDARFKILTDGIGTPEKLFQFIRKWDYQRKINIKNYMPEWREFLD